MLDQVVTHDGMRVHRQTVLGTTVDVIEQVAFDKDGQRRITQWEAFRSRDYATISAPESDASGSRPSLARDREGRPATPLARSTQSPSAAITSARKSLTDATLIRDNRAAAQAAARTFSQAEYNELPHLQAGQLLPGAVVAVSASGQYRAGVVVAVGRVRATVAYHIASSDVVRLATVRQDGRGSMRLVVEVPAPEPEQPTPPAPAAEEEGPAREPQQDMLDTLRQYGAAWAWPGDPAAQALAAAGRAQLCTGKHGAQGAECWRYLPGDDEIAVGDLVATAATGDVVRLVDRLGHPWYAPGPEFAWVIKPSEPHAGQWMPVEKLERLERPLIHAGDRVRRNLPGTGAHNALATVVRYDEELSAGGWVMVWVRWASGPYDGQESLTTADSWTLEQRTWPPQIGMRQLRQPRQAGADRLALRAALLEAHVAGKRWEDPIPFDGDDGPVAGYVLGWCGHRVAESEWRAGFRACERCPMTAAAGVNG